MNRQLLFLTTLAVCLTSTGTSGAAEPVQPLDAPLPPVADTFVAPPVAPGSPGTPPRRRSKSSGERDNEAGFLAQAGGAGLGLDPSAIAEWANNVATITTEQTLDTFFTRGTPRLPVLVGGERDAKANAALEEDLNIMMRILEKAAGAKEEGKPTAGGIELFSFSSSGSPRVFYIEGYGPMFVLRVKYPLVALPKRETDGQTNEPVNTEWEKAREEVTGRPRLSETFKTAAGPAEEFDAQRVEKLKQKLIESLVQAANIRNIKPDDQVTVVLAGTGTRAKSSRRELRPGAGRSGGAGNLEIVLTSAEQATQTTMTLRVNKSEVDALAKGRLKPVDFEKKVQIQAYASGRSESR